MSPWLLATTTPVALPGLTATCWLVDCHDVRWPGGIVYYQLVSDAVWYRPEGTDLTEQYKTLFVLGNDDFHIYVLFPLSVVTSVR